MVHFYIFCIYIYVYFKNYHLGLARLSISVLQINIVKHKKISEIGPSWHHCSLEIDVV